MQREPGRETLDGHTQPLGQYGQTIPQDSTAMLPVVPSQDTGARPDAFAGFDLPVGIAMLIVVHGPNAGARFLLDRDVTLAGRHPDSDIFLDDITVSRRHAEFQREGDSFTIVDSGSLNGIYVNRQRLETNTLADGDEVQIGKFRMTFHTTPQPHR